MVNLKSEEMKKSLIYALLVLVAVSVAACTEDKTNDLPQNGVESDGNLAGSDIEGEKIRLYLGVDEDAEDSRTSLSEISVVWSENDRVLVNGALYNVAYDENGAPYLDVLHANDGSYVAYYPGDYAQFTSAPQHFKLNPMQFYVENSFGPDANPMCATINMAVVSEKPTLKFKSMCGVLALNISGDAEIESIYVEDQTGAIVSGTFTYDASAQKLVEPTFSAATQVARPGVVLNCIGTDGRGVQLSGAGTMFYIVMPARTYASGLKIRICDTENKCMTIDSRTSRTIHMGSILFTPEIKYAPAANCVFEEHFDLMVWGGDYMGGGAKGRGFTPLAANTPATTSVTGYERTLYISTYTYPGTEFMSTSNTDYTEFAHQMSESYLRSRGVYSCPWLLRVDERPGYIGVGARANGCGRYRTAPFATLSGASKVAVEFRMSFTAGAEVALDAILRNAGYISEAYVDGVEIAVTSDRYQYTYSTDEQTGKLTGVAKFTLKCADVGVPKTVAVTKNWHTVKLVVNDAYADTALEFYPSVEEPIAKLGFFVDDIVVTKIKDQSGDMLKVLSYNIQNGMWADQGNNYDNFVAFVNKHAPDICLWQEARTIYKTGTSTGFTTGTADKLILAASNFLIDYNHDLKWGHVAKRYGHTNWDYGAYQDNFPVVITTTSAYPINLVQTLGARSKGTNKQTAVAEVSHGGLHAKVDGVNYINLHLWPQQYGRNVAEADREASAANNEGHAYRKGELEYMFGKTVWNDKYSSETKWVMAGDFNSRSRLDENYYKYGLSSPLYWAQDVILDRTEFIDIMSVVFGSTCPFGSSRIDYVFASPEMMKRVVRIRFIDKEDEFTTREKPEGWPFHKYSDHRPIIVEFDMSE